jgi:hypothetical protein
VTLGLFAGVFLWGYRALESSSQTVLAAAPEHEQKTGYERDYGAFCEALGAWRGGEDEALGDLRAAARRLAEEHNRPDALRASAYYERLNPAEREAGLADSRRFGELWQEVESAPNEGWSVERESLLKELRGFIARTTARADFVPAGHALALAARIEVRALEANLSDAEQEDKTQRAAQDIREALAIFKRSGLETPRLEPLWLKAKLALLAEAEESAEDLYAEVLEVAEACRVDDYRERALLGLESVALGRGDLPEVERLLAELASFRQPSKCWPLARGHANQLLHADSPRKAAEFLLRNRPLGEDDREQLDQWRQLMALVRLRQGDPEGALGLLDALQQGPMDEELMVLRARVALKRNELREVRRILTKESLAGFSLRTQQAALALRGEAWLALDEPALALAELTAAGDIARTWERRLERQRALEDTSATIFGEWSGLHTQALEARALGALGRGTDAALAIESAQSHAWRGARPDPTTRAEIENWAAHFELGLVTWIFGADSSLAVSVDQNGAAATLRIDRSRKQVLEAVRRMREALLAGDEVLAGRLSGELVELLFPPGLLERLEGSATRERLLCIAHGPLELLPLEAVTWGGRSLDERATCLVLPELPSRTPGSAPGLAAAWVLVGDPMTNSGDLRLPAAGPELEGIGKIWPAASRYSGRDFTRAALVTALESEQPVHIATHLRAAAACDEGRFSALGLELDRGQVICAAELARVRVTSPLVVLSACDTAGGRAIDARGRQGLARALFEGGARNLAVTLWPVADQAAAEFTRRFHGALGEGLEPSQAARRARVELREAGASSADWAAFRLAGRD